MNINEKQTTELNEALKGMWNSLTDEQKEKAKNCKSMDELTALAGRMGIELPDELLESVAGGLIVVGEFNVYTLDENNNDKILYKGNSDRKAYEVAEEYNVSDQRLSKKTYEQLLGKVHIC